METLGVCPSCQKGQITPFEKGYGCNYNSADDKCLFFIYKEMYGKPMTLDIVAKVITDKETDFYSDLRSKAGKVFSAKLVVSDGSLKPNFESTVLKAPCPLCRSKVLGFSNSYQCEMAKSKECDFYLPKEVSKRTIEVKEAEKLCLGQKTDFLDGFYRNDGKEFSASLYLDPEVKVRFDSTISDCPKCKKGKVLINPKAYSCSNFKDEAGRCDFVIWREMQGKSISPDITAIKRWPNRSNKWV
jgi:hypothetical protein